MQVFLYNFILRCYHFGIWLAAFFKPKARLWIEGRVDYFKKLELAFAGNKRSVLWMHCASLGEFEQGRPILEAYKEARPDCRILLTFFSPSGYEVRKNYAQADDVFYLPLDTKNNAKRFLQIVQPDMVVFVKYEFWFHFLTRLKQQNIPAVLVSAIFHPNQIFFKWYGGLHRKMLTCFQHVFVQNESSKNLLNQHLMLNGLSVAGDTRVDRVLRIANEKSVLPLIKTFVTDSRILVAGSTWLADELVLHSFINDLQNNWKFIIAPHEIGESRIKSIEEKLNVPFVRYSHLKEEETSEAKVLIIDNIGMLSSLYRFARIAYVGGGFGKGIHNILEAAAYGIPVLFGPAHQQFAEANILKKEGGGFAIHNQSEFEPCIQKLSDEDVYRKACFASQQFMSNHKGATNRIMDFLSKK